MSLCADTSHDQNDELTLLNEDDSMDPDDEIHGMEIQDGFRIQASLRPTRGHSATCGLLVGILQWKVSKFRFGGLISASSKLSARKLNEITSLRSIWNNFTRHLQLYNVKKKNCDGSSIYYTEICIA